MNSDALQMQYWQQLGLCYADGDGRACFVSALRAQSTAAIHSPATSYMPESRGAGWQLPGMQLPELLLLLLLILPLPACIHPPCLRTGLRQASALI